MLCQVWVKQPCCDPAPGPLNIFSKCHRPTAVWPLVSQRGLKKPRHTASGREPARRLDAASLGDAPVAFGRREGRLGVGTGGGGEILGTARPRSTQSRPSIATMAPGSAPLTPVIIARYVSAALCLAQVRPRAFRLSPACWANCTYVRTPSRRRLGNLTPPTEIVHREYWSVF